MRQVAFNAVSDKDLGYVWGLFLGDGYAHYNEKDRHYSIEFFLNSIRDVLERLRFILSKLNLISSVFKDPRGNVLRVRVRSKQFFNLLRHGLNMSNLDFKIGVVSGFIDAEGCVQKGMILIAQKEEATIRTIQTFCGQLGVRCLLRKAPNSRSDYIWRGSISTRFKYLPHASEKVWRAYPLPTIASRNAAYKGRTAWSVRWAHNPKVRGSRWEGCC